MSDELTGRELFLRAAANERTPRPPVWLMRQAGRYLPEYRARREEYSFTEGISTPEVAVDISLQPWRRFAPDGVVMYSDILVALEPLGWSYHLEPGVGPVIDNPVQGPEDIVRAHEPIDEHLGYVGELLEQLSARLDDAAAVIGFVGGPFTVAAYAVEGRPSRTYMTLRRLHAQHPAAFERLLETIGDVLEAFVAFQVDRGADVIQLFDTYAGLLTTETYRSVLLPIQQRVLEAAEVPTIIFARNMGGRLDLLADSGADVIGIDWTIEMAKARELLGSRPVQGNLDPAELYAEPAVVRDRTRALIEQGGSRGHILNLGHGIDKDTPIDGVQAFIDTAKSYRRPADV